MTDFVVGDWVEASGEVFQISRVDTEHGIIYRHNGTTDTSVWNATLAKPPETESSVDPDFTRLLLAYKSSILLAVIWSGNVRGYGSEKRLQTIEMEHEARLRLLDYVRNPKQDRRYVPVEPTENMLVVGREAMMPVAGRLDTYGPVIAVWKNMLEAAPDA